MFGPVQKSWNWHGVKLTTLRYSYILQITFVIEMVCSVLFFPFNYSFSEIRQISHVWQSGLSGLRLEGALELNRDKWQQEISLYWYLLHLLSVTNEARKIESRNLTVG